jgi:hypothetical protein
MGIRPFLLCAKDQQNRLASGKNFGTPVGIFKLFYQLFPPERRYQHASHGYQHTQCESLGQGAKTL